MDKVILHSDLNNFYASVECMRNPTLAGKPVAVAGDPSKRHGIVLAKNEAAKKKGVKTGEPLWSARQKCRDIIFVPPDYEEYRCFSEKVKSIYCDYTDQVESFGLDECWLDVTGSGSLFGDGVKIADDIRARVKKETGITVSVGVSYNKVFAKLGSDMKKPDATTVISRESFMEKVWCVPAENMLMAGPSVMRRIKPYGIRTIGDIARSDQDFLEQMLGSIGRTLWLYANGMDNSPVMKVWETPPPLSIGNSFTMPRDLESDEDIKTMLMSLCDTVSSRLRKEGMICRTVSLSVRDNAMRWYERQCTLPRPCCTSGELLHAVMDLYRRYPPGRPVRSLGVRTTGLCLRSSEQLSMLPEISVVQKKERLERTVDEIREKYGKSGILRASVIGEKAKSEGGYLSFVSNDNFIGGFSGH